MFAFDSKVATVRPWLLLGAAPHEHDYALLRSCGVTHILQVGAELRPSYPGRFEYERTSLEDVEQEDIIRHLPRCFKFIDSARRPDFGEDDGFVSCARCSELEGAVATCCFGGGAAAATPNFVAAAKVTPGGGATYTGAVAPGGGGGVVLVHCAAGMSRSATVVISYLMASERLPYDTAFQEVKTARPCVYPNLGFLFQLWEWEAAGYDFDRWAGWNQQRFVERLAQYRRAQKAAGLHPAVRVRLPLGPPGAADGAGAGGGGGRRTADGAAAAEGGAADGAASGTAATSKGADGSAGAIAPAGCKVSVDCSAAAMRPGGGAGGADGNGHCRVAAYPDGGSAGGGAGGDGARPVAEGTLAASPPPAAAQGRPCGPPLTAPPRALRMDRYAWGSDDGSRGGGAAAAAGGSRPVVRYETIRSAQLYRTDQ